ncbi:MAG TPA: hypothetical protein VGC84_19585 [Ilumatobacteraceae bacterium]
MARKSLEDLVRQSSLSFTGTVNNVEAATMSDVPVDKRTVVMRVDAVLHAPPSLRNLVGSQVTVQLAPRSKVLSVDETVTLFTEPVVFGDTLAVREIGRLPANAMASRTMAAAASGTMVLEDVAKQVADSDLADHARGADAVVVGRVAGLTKADSSTLLEHDPDWWVATVEVSQVVRGKLRRGDLRVLYANSQDVRWRDHPKPRAAQEAAWILHLADPKISKAARYVLADAADVQPVQFIESLTGGA